MQTASILYRFEILLATVPTAARKDIDRQGRAYLAVQELLSIVEPYLRPMSPKIEVCVSKAPTGETVFQKLGDVASSTAILGLPRDFDVWTGEHSKVAVKETICFLNHFFSDLCCFSTEEASGFLSIWVASQGKGYQFLPVHAEALFRRTEAEYGIGIHFLIF